MKLSELLDSGLIEKIPASAEKAEHSLTISERDLDTAEHLFDKNDFDWCFSVAYNAMLQAGRAIMWLKGYRPRGSSSHISIIEFVKAVESFNEPAQVTFLLNKMRQKRHLLVYEEAGVISENEAESALKNARLFIDKIKEVLKI